MSIAPDPFAPATLGPLTLRNRFIKAATFEGVTPDGLVTRELIDFHLRPVRGGIAMTTVAYLAVAPEGRTDPGCMWLRPEALPGLRRLTDEIHQAGALVAGQIGHAGPVANAKRNRATSLGPSKMFNPMSLRTTQAIDEAGIARVTEDYARGARLMVEAGFDSIEIHLAHNYLLSSFLSPRFNKRTDDWSGSLDNRARFARQVVAAVRAEAPATVAVTAKISLNDGVPGGFRPPDSTEFAALLEADGHLDALEMTGGSSLANPIYLFKGDAPRKEFAAALPFPMSLGFKLFGKKFMPSYPFEEAYFRPLALEVRERVDMPLIFLGGINNLATVRQAMSDGFDFVAMGRAVLREPDLITRMQDGTQTEGDCIHCNRCMVSIYSGSRCVVDVPDPILTTGPVA
ncbi:MAG: NADH:flavin oxidoreductase [Actinobacteria bacterium]|nr:NADH:flavin oxidoreductase [Actinomycetota bacterium]